MRRSFSTETGFASPQLEVGRHGPPLHGILFMKTISRFSSAPRGLVFEWKELAEQAFSRTAGAPLIGGNSIRLLRDARENYPAWLEAIGSSREHVHLENYIFSADRTGEKFADALSERAEKGVRIRLIYDWVGCFMKTPGKFWDRLRRHGIEVRCYNPPRFDSPLGWLSRDHRKVLSVDGNVGFVSGLCIADEWEGIPEKKIDPWRDTGVELRGPAVAELEQSFSMSWEMTGTPLPPDDPPEPDPIVPAGDASVRLVAGLPSTVRMMRLDQLIAALAKKRLWLTDAYYAGTAAYVQALRALAEDGADVRLLVPHGTDIPLLRPLSRSGYRTLLEAGIRIFEWNGTMLHAKTAVADGVWARVGSTNLNMSSWLGNCEMDVVVVDAGFARQMEDMYIEDLKNSTEVVLDERRKVRAPGEPRHPRQLIRKGGGSVSRAAAGAIRITNVVGAAVTDKRILEPVESRIMIFSGLFLLLLAALFMVFPFLLAYPLILVILWISVILIYRGIRLRSERKVSSLKDPAK